MFLETQSNVNTIPMSNLLENGLLHKYDNILSYESAKPKFENITLELENKLFNTFTNILKNESFEDTFFLERFIQSDNEINGYGRTCYSSKSEYTLSSMKTLLEVLYYVQYTHDNKLPIFENISEDNNDLIFIENQDYNIKEQADFNKLLQYFFKFFFVFKITQKN